MAMDINDAKGISTLVIMFAFIGMWVWAWSKKRRTTFDEAAMQLFDKDEERIHQRSIEEANKK
jgi:cytochrome c oxidase cbb3-type subunit 4